MRVFKPLQLSLQHKPYRWQEKNLLSVSLLLGFPFDRNRETLLEQDLWQFVAEQVEEGVIDACMPKIQGEVLVYGSYFSPGGKPVTADRVQLKIGTLDKSLSVIGDRYWGGVLGPSKPEPFTEMPIAYQHAFGGKDYKPNPVGKGMDEVDYFGEPRLPMPNIEDPDWLITSRNARPQPAGFGPLDLMWEYRASKMGTYDEDWLQSHFPGYPLDIDWTHFNCAAPDQWVSDFWAGDEVFSLLNMHPDKTEVSGSLPAFRTRCFVEHLRDSEVLLSEVEMRAETVCLFPSEETAVLIYRGVIEIEEDDASDVENILAAYEDLSQAPKSREHYAQALHGRLDESKVFKYLMNTTDIIPDSERCGFARMMEGAELDAESPFSSNINARVEAEKEKALAQLDEYREQLRGNLEKAGIDPAPYLKKFTPQDGPPDDPQIQAIMQTMEYMLPGSTSDDPKMMRVEQVDFSQFDELERQVQEMAESKKNEARQQLQEMVDKVAGTEIEPAVREQVEAALAKMDELPDLPRPESDELLGEMRNQFNKLQEVREKMIAQGIGQDKLPELDFELEEAERQIREGFESIKEMYREGAHFVEGKPPHKEPMDIIQYRLVKSLDKGESLAGRDLAGADFSGRDLSGIDLSDCYLEYANFSGSKLTGANLQRSVVTHANLSGADLVNADLRDSNLGDSNLGQANLDHARLENSEFSKANLSKARITDCNLGEMNFLESVLTDVDLSGSCMDSTNFLSLDFSGGKFVKAQMRQCNFLQCQLENTDFSRATLSGSNFVECNLDRSKFIEADLNNARFPGECSMRHCRFDRADLQKVNMRDADAEDSVFEYATFNQADFSNANMKRGKFYAAEGKRAMLMKTDLGDADFSSVNLMEGSLMKARLTGADLSDSNLYGVEFLDATVGETDFRGANLDLTKLEKWMPDHDA